MIMKRISKRILFIFMSMLLAQNCHLQASTTVAVAAGKAAVDALKATAPLIEEAAKAAAPVATGFFKKCGQKVGAATMKHVIRPAFVLGRAIALTTGTGLGLYKGGELLVEKIDLSEINSPQLHLPPVNTQGLFDGLFRNWPNGSTPDVGTEVVKKADSWGSWLSRNTGLDYGIDCIKSTPGYLKNSSLGKLATEHPTLSTMAAAWLVAGFVYEGYYKQRQLERLNTLMNKGIWDGSKQTTTHGTSWAECQAILTATGQYPNTTPDNARVYIDRINNGDLSIKQNTWVAALFCLHPYSVYKKMTR